MGIQITPLSTAGRAIEKIVEYLSEMGYSDEAENVHEYLQDGNFEIGGWFVNLIGAGGFAPFPDTGSGATIYLKSTVLPDVGEDWNFDDADSTDYLELAYLLALILHEKFHTEQQGWIDRMWFILEWLTFPLGWFGIAYNPMETEAAKDTISMLDKIIDTLLNRAARLSSVVPPTANFSRIENILKEVTKFFLAKRYVADAHNNKYRPDFPLEKLEDARIKLETLSANLGQELSAGVLGFQVNLIQGTLNQFETDMANV